MRVHVADHPLITHKLTALRDEQTDSPTFRRLTEELVTLLAYEATRDVRAEPITGTTPGATGRAGGPGAAGLGAAPGRTGGAHHRDDSGGPGARRQAPDA